MNDEKNNNISPLDEINYYSSEKKKNDPSNVTAPVLDDFEYDTPVTKKNSGPQGVNAPILDDMSTYSPNVEKKGAPQNVSAPILEDNELTYNSKTSNKHILSDAEIINGMTPEQQEAFNKLPENNKKQVIDMRRSQLESEKASISIPVPTIEETEYIPSPKKTELSEPDSPATVAPILDEVVEAPKYVPKFVDEDIERVKREAAKKAVSSQLTSDQKDSKESLKMMLQLKEERKAEMVAKGFKITIIISVIELIAAVAFYLLYSGKLGLSYKDGLDGISKVIENSALYFSMAIGGLSLLMISGIGAFKSLNSLLLLLFGIIQLFPGLFMIPQHNGNMALVVGLYAVSLICTIASFIALSGSECVGLFFKKNH